MNQQEAQRVALEYLKSRAGVAPELQLEILEQATIEKPYGWVFFYQSKKYLKTGSISDALFGNGPVLVLGSGKIVQLPTAIPTDEALKRYEAGLPVLPRPGMPDTDAKVLQDIQRVGWHVVKVFVPKDEEGPDWAYSIGLFHSFGHPEVILFGLALDRCMTLVNVIGRQVKAGKRYQSGEEYADILQDPYKCAFRDVGRDHYRDYVGYASWFYETDPFPLTQCFWPDKQGRFPWDESCDDYVRRAQPLLFIS